MTDNNVIETDDNSITLIDKTHSKVCLKETSIEFIKEKIK